MVPDFIFVWAIIIVVAIVIAAVFFATCPWGCGSTPGPAARR
jgi:hypothetical protein